MVRFSWGVCTHVGHVRAVNEDQYVVEPPVFLVADGMGGHDQGEIASGLVADEFSALARQPSLDPDEVAAALRRAHQSVRRAGAASAAERGMGTTLTAIVLVGDGTTPMWLIANVGDSRAYRLSDGVLKQLTVDHSLVQELVAEGQITREQARTHPERNVVTRAVGIDEEVVADYVLIEPVVGERFLICSDGVHGEMADDELLAVLRAHPDAQGAAAALIETVLDGTARDNLTAVVVDTEAIDDDGAIREDTNPILEVALAPPEVPIAADEASGLIEVPEW